MSAMKKSEVLERLRLIQKRNNENNLAILEVIHEVKRFGELSASDSSAIRSKLYRLEDNAFDFRNAINRLEGAMYHSEARCYDCGEIDSCEENPMIKDEDGSHIHQKCLEKLEANREASRQSVKDYFAGKRSTSNE